MTRPVFVGTITKLGKALYGVKGLNPRDRAKLSATMGQCRDYDAGKRVYRVGEIFQVENSEQYNARIDREAGG